MKPPFNMKIHWEAVFRKYLAVIDQPVSLEFID